MILPPNDSIKLLLSTFINPARTIKSGFNFFTSLIQVSSAILLLKLYGPKNKLGTDAFLAISKIPLVSTSEQTATISAECSRLDEAASRTALQLEPWPEPKIIIRIVLGWFRF